MQLASRGKRFTEIEELLFQYFSLMGELKYVIERKKVYGINQRWPKKLIEQHHFAFQQFRESDKEKLCRLFMSAIDARDETKIIEIANAIKFLKTFKPSTDTFRYQLLSWKRMFDKGAIPIWTIRDVARIIGWPEKTSQDGFSRLRRLCAELKIPIIPSRQISRI